MAKIKSQPRLTDKWHISAIDFIVEADIKFYPEEQERDWEVEMTLLEIDMPERRFEHIKTYTEPIRPRRETGAVTKRFRHEETITKDTLKEELSGEWTREEIFAAVRVAPKVADEASQADMEFSNIVKLYAGGED